MTNRKDRSIDTPVVVMIYNRPEHTTKVLSEVKEANPPAVFVVADGSKSESDRLRCERTRDVISEIGFSCELKRNFTKDNL
jgi:GT2 family glycosyltransferase